MFQIKLPKYEVFRSDKDRQWYWRLKGANGEIQSVSEGYPSRYNAKRGAKAARRNSLIAFIHDVY